MDDLEEKLIKIHIDIMKDKYYMADFHWQEAKEAFENAEKEGKPITGYCRELGAKIAKVAIDKIEEGAIKICEGHSRPSSKRLDELEKNFQEILASIDSANQEFPQIFSANFVAEIKRRIKKFREEFAPLLRKFAKLHDRLEQLIENEKNFAWQKVEKLWNEAEREAATPQPTPLLSELAENQKNAFFGEITLGTFNLIETINKEKEDIPPNAYPSTAQELNFLQKIADEFPTLFEFAKKTREFDELKDKNAKIQEIQQKNEQLKNFIQQERKKRGSSSSTRTDKKPNEPQNKPNPQDIQKINEQSAEIASLKKQLSELQQQIKDLEKAKTSAPQSISETNQKIEALQKQKENIQQQIRQKTSAKKRLESKINSPDSTPNNSGFN